MRVKIILMAVLIIGCVAANIRAEEIKLQPIDFYHPAVKAAVALQEAREKGNFEVLWEQLSKKKLAILGPGGFREQSLRLQEKNIFALTSKANLVGIRVISDNRVWVEARNPDMRRLKGFYFVKENGEWKFAGPIDYTIKQVGEDLDSLSNIIQDYYKKNNNLPKDLAELSAEIPADLFSDSNAPYKYKVINNVTYIVYSLGPDSRDDFGLTEYNRKEHPISSGDIIKQVVVPQ